MLNKFSIFLLLAFLSAVTLRAQEPPPPLLLPGEYYTHLWSASYDFQTNGSVRYLVQDPANASKWCAILMAQPDSTTALGEGRYIYYAYSEDNGDTWAADVVDGSFNYGFPCMTLSNGIPVIASHRSAALGTLVFKDAFFGAYGFSQIAGVPNSGPAPPIWPHIAGTANENLVLAGEPNPITFGMRSTYNGTSWSPYTGIPLLGGPSGNFDVAAGPNGQVAIIGQLTNTFTAGGPLVWYQSGDNGITFDDGNTIIPYIVDGSDTLRMNLIGGYQAVYDNNGIAHIVFAAYTTNLNAVFPDPNTIAYVKPGIYHWSSAGGSPVRIAGRVNIPTLTDTVTQSANPPLTQPTISRTASGKLVCAFTTFLRGNTQVVQDGSVVNAGEIFLSSSSDNGATWGAPVNLTNTPNVEEKHPSLALTTNTDSIRIYYIRDLKAGGWVLIPGWGLAPVYGIFKKAPPTVGIQDNISQVKTFELFQNYPNPFNPKTIINYSIPSNVKREGSNVKLIIYNAMGQEVATLINQKQTAGSYSVDFDGEGLPSGIYFYRLEAGDFAEAKRMILLK